MSLGRLHAALNIHFLIAVSSLSPCQSTTNNLEKIFHWEKQYLVCVRSTVLKLRKSKKHRREPWLLGFHYLSRHGQPATLVSVSLLGSPLRLHLLENGKCVVLCCVVFGKRLQNGKQKENARAENAFQQHSDTAQFAYLGQRLRVEATNLPNGTHNSSFLSSSPHLIFFFFFGCLVYLVIRFSTSMGGGRFAHLASRQRRDKFSLVFLSRLRWL